MDAQPGPRLNKVPFLAGDLLLLAAAAWLVLRAGPAPDVWRDLLVVVCVGTGAWLAALPFLAEHRAGVRLAEAGELASTIEQVKGLQAVGQQVAGATARWQSVQDSAERTTQAAREMAEQITQEARSFAESMQKAHDVEVRNLRLEVEKLHRAEGDWLQVLVRVMDHVHALYAAGAQSGQPQLAAQLGHFQRACREAIRRVGLAALEAEPDAPWDERLHELPPGAAAVKEGCIAQTLATGFTYQGQLLRRILVAVKPPPEPPQADPTSAESASGASPPTAEPSPSPAPAGADAAQLALGGLPPPEGGQ
jgi:molecular chaperone GrpE (heat shock protein)